jgi:small subunit ribosomal protein S1
MATPKDEYRENFRPGMDAELDSEINDALSEVSLDALYDDANAKKSAVARAAAKGMRRGRVILVDLAKNEVLVDFGKNQGVCPLAQFEKEPKVGDEVDFVFVRRDPREDILILALPGAKATNVNWENLQVGQIVEGTVSKVLEKGGLEVDVKGMRAFMPASQVDLYFVQDISTYLNQRITAEVTQFDRDDRNLILSRRNVLEREREAKKQQFFETIEVGTMLHGTVRNVRDFGAFVDVGGVDGLIPVSEMAFTRVNKASDVVKEGDIVDVKVIRLDKEAGKITLSLKQAMPDPWREADQKYPVGSSLTGLVTRVENFGAFVQVEEGIEGLLPISEMSYQRIGHPSDLVKPGDTVKLVVLSIDPAARRMSMSMKQAGPDPWKTVEERFATDMVVSGKVTRTADFGAFVELEPGLEGLVHISELSGQRVNSVSQAVQVGQEVKVAVLDVDKEHRRLSLSIKKVAELMVPERAPEPAKPKKPRPQLRGGLDFDYKKNK